MPLPTQIQDIVQLYKTNVDHTVRTFSIPGYSTHGAETLNQVLDTEYNSTEKSLRRMHALFPSSFELTVVLDGLMQYKNEQLTSYVRDTPNPTPSTDSRRTNPHALDIIRGKK
jgi:hypothetical protein